MARAFQIISRISGIIGVPLGLWAGFITRDEQYFPSQNRMEEVY